MTKVFVEQPRYTRSVKHCRFIVNQHVSSETEKEKKKQRKLKHFDQNMGQGPTLVDFERLKDKANTDLDDNEEKRVGNIKKK